MSSYPPVICYNFFLSTFGEGITRLYLQPYNEKIWKFDPSFMDTQMVDRIPKPPREDIIASANGVETEGYTHQLYYHYPKQGGFQSLVDAYADNARTKGQTIKTSCDVKAITKVPEGWRVDTEYGPIESRTLVNCMPIHELMRYLNPPADVRSCLDRMVFNSIHVVAVQVSKDRIGNHFAIYVPDKNVIFHRLSKLNYLGPAYQLENDCSTLLAEVTFRSDSFIGTLTEEIIIKSVLDGLNTLGFVAQSDVIDVAIRTEKYAYVIYDLDHRRNTDTVLSWLREQGIRSSGRFAEFEYLNTDAVVSRTLALSREMNQNASN